MLIITSFTLDQPARLDQSTDSETATLSTWPPNQGRSDTKSESDIDGRLSRRQFCPRQPSLPSNVDQRWEMYGYAGRKIWSLTIGR